MRKLLFMLIAFSLVNCVEYDIYNDDIIKGKKQSRETYYVVKLEVYSAHQDIQVRYDKNGKVTSKGNVIKTSKRFKEASMDEASIVEISKYSDQSGKFTFSVEKLGPSATDLLRVKVYINGLLIEEIENTKKINFEHKFKVRK